VLQALSSLAEECTSIGRELLDFVAKFKIDQDSGPKAKDVPNQRVKHQDEGRLENEIRLQTPRVRVLEEVVARIKAEEKRRRTIAEMEAKKKKAQEEKESKTVARKLRDILKKRSKNLHEAELGRKEVESLIEMRLKQKREIGLGVETVLARKKASKQPEPLPEETPRKKLEPSP
jgi:hypothetical protein